MKKSLIFLAFISIFISCKESKTNSIEKKTTKAANVFLLEEKFVFDKISAVSHKIWVYLPPNYNKSEENFPVIYMHDGQNLFDDATSFIGEWQVDETLNKLYEKTGKSFIVVGISNGGEKRIDEYTPWINSKYGGGKGAFYIDFLVDTLKPLIDSKYKTLKEAENTAIIGSSLGGLISFYGGLEYPSVFGKIGALSTSFWFSDKVWEFAKEKATSTNTKLYLLVGTKEGAGMDEDTKKMESLLLQSRFPSENLKTKIVEGAEHNETFWKNELLEVITFLFNLDYESTNH